MAGVVRELQVDVRVVDGRVAPERIVGDVERVVRALDDRQAGLVRRVEDGGRDLADAAAEAGLQLAVDDHRRLEEALLRAPLAGRAVERERLAGRDQLAVDEMRDELDVVDAIRVAAVERLVGRDRAGDPHRLRLRRRAGRLPLARARAARRGWSSCSAAARMRAAERGTSSAMPGTAGTTRTRAARVDREAGVLRSVVEAPLEPREVAIGGGAAERELGRAARSGGEGSSRAASAGCAAASVRRRRSPARRSPGWRRAGRRRASRRSPTAGRSRTGSATGARENDASAETITARAAARSSTRPVDPGCDRDVQAATDEPRLAVRRVDRPRQQAELVGHAGVVGVRLRRDILREELEPEPLVAADEPEARSRVRSAFATVAFQSTCDAEAARRQAKGLAAGGERDRDASRASRRAARAAAARPPASGRRRRRRRHACPWRACSGEPAKRKPSPIATGRRRAAPESRAGTADASARTRGGERGEPSRTLPLPEAW